jgi:hypothetical protein
MGRTRRARQSGCVIIGNSEADLSQVTKDFGALCMDAVRGDSRLSWIRGERVPHRWRMV